ncbi:MAG TPA: DUF2111 domain-containing protein, partial [Methanomassiliicoccales archaeon]|nr:DUF2111 domain-containing protein [Methanomassiliicoccales archaeon]
RRALARLLALSGAKHVAEASDGQEALEQLADNRFDLVLSDLHMPRLDGIGLVCAMRSAGDRTPLIMLTADEDARMVVKAVRAGAVGATTLVVDQGRIVFPGDEEFPDQSLVAPLKNYFRMDDGDVIIIGSAFSYDAAEKGAVTAALALSNLSRRCWNEGTELLSRDTEADELRCLALAVHELLGRLPVTMRSRNRPGVRCEEGEVIDTHYTGPMLEEAMKRGAIVRRVSTSGPYRGLPVIAVPIMRKREAIAAIATMDIGKGSLSELLAKLAERY